MINPRWRQSTASASLLALGVITSAGRSSAQETPPQPPQPLLTMGPRMNLTTPAPEPVVRRSYKVHNGFYLRGSVGLGSMVADYGSPHGSGLGMASDLLIGGSPSPGFSLGGALLMDTMLSTDLGRALGPKNVSILVVGPFVDGFFDPKNGWHLGGSFGVATNSVRELGSGTFVGFGGAGWFGYDAWAGDEWSVGGMVRVLATRTWNTREGSSLDGSTRSISFLVTALFN